MIQRHEANTQGRDFFVGDIHGQMDLLDSEMSRVGFDKGRDRLFSVGDLIDRGARSLDCLSLAFEPWFHGVRGNHEMLALNALLIDNEGDWMPHELWMSNGGTWALGENLREVKATLEAALEHLPYAREVEVDGQRIGMVHAEPPKDWATLWQVDGPNRVQMVWGRTRIQQQDETPVIGIDAVVVGHTIVGAPTQLGNVHYIDTGAFHTGRLTLIEARELLA
ncbi:metallophosphoesterase [Halomonas organivorans]|uniref:Serine/threonine protein phosphatase 1 n=1 Tax=Halomonas organivorans TaxID=257772 RepID=A0A7W5G7R2_9GAMM|nr:metallophosphoesterase [Halomonas organivorans]MBB3142806.1 serine/threonine protein phosphatase 1 [Halomonas organivorans]